MVTKQMVTKWAWLMILDKCRSSKATAKHHKHIHNPQFKSISHSGISPAEYRHEHRVMVNGILRKAKKGKKK